MQADTDMEFVIKCSSGDSKRAKIVFFLPPNAAGDGTWKLDGCVKGDLNCSFQGKGPSPFEALISAKKEVKKYIKKEAKGGKLYFVDNIRDVGDVFPEGGCKLNEFFWD